MWAVFVRTQTALLRFTTAWAEIAPRSPREVLQRAYIFDNPNPTGSKELLDRAEGGLEYDRVHEEYHDMFRALLREKGYYDIFLFDLDGNLIYSVFKELDYATNFVSGPYAESGLGKAFRAALAQPERISEVPFEPYEPSYGALASFISTGVRLGERVAGVIAFQLPSALASWA